MTHDEQREVDDDDDPRLVADRDLLVRLKAALPALRENSRRSPPARRRVPLLFLAPVVQGVRPTDREDNDRVGIAKPSLLSVRCTVVLRLSYDS